MFSVAVCSSSVARFFISCAYCDITLVWSAIFCTFPSAAVVFSLTLFVVADTSSIVAESSSMIAEISLALSLDAATLLATFPTTPSRTLELLMMLDMIFCSVSIKWLIPIDDCPISSIDFTVTRFVRSPCPPLISSIISVSSLVCFLSGFTTVLIITTTTMTNATKEIASRISDSIIFWLYRSFCSWIFCFTNSSLRDMSVSILTAIVSDHSVITEFAFATAAAESPAIAVCISSTVVPCASVSRSNVSFISWISSAVK